MSNTSRKTLAGSSKVGEITFVAALEAAGGTAGGSAKCAGIIRGLSAATGVEVPVVDEVTGDRRTHNVRFGSPDGDLCNFGRGQMIFDGALPSGKLISVKVNDSRDITTAVPVINALLDAGSDVIVYSVTCDSKPVREGDTVMQPATNMKMRRLSMQRVYQAQGQAMWNVADASTQFAFVRMDGNTPRLRVNFRTVPESCWIDAEYTEIHFEDDFSEGTVYESANEAAPIAEANGVKVWNSGKVQIDGHTLMLREAMVPVLAAIINAKGEPVQAPCRVTINQMKKKLGHASEFIKNKRGKGYYWAA